MAISGINRTNSYRRNKIINAKTTGCASAAGIGLSIYSGMSKNKTVRKSHKLFAGFTLLSTLAHIFTVGLNHRKSGY